MSCFSARRVSLAIESRTVSASNNQDIRVDSGTHHSAFAALLRRTRSRSANIDQSSHSDRNRNRNADRRDRSRSTNNPVVTSEGQRSVTASGSISANNAAEQSAVSSNQTSSSNGRRTAHSSDTVRSWAGQRSVTSGSGTSRKVNSPFLLTANSRRRMETVTNTHGSSKCIPCLISRMGLRCTRHRHKAFISKQHVPWLLRGAIRSNNLETLQYLLSYPNVVDPNMIIDNVCPLNLAIEVGHLSAVRLLLKAGADVHLRDAPRSAVHQAALFGRAEMIELLVRSGCDVNERNDAQQNALHLIAAQTSRKYVDTAIALLSNGCDANARDRNGYTPLHIASFEIAAALLRDAPRTRSHLLAAAVRSSLERERSLTERDRHLVRERSLTERDRHAVAVLVRERDRERSLTELAIVDRPMAGSVVSAGPGPTAAENNRSESLDETDRPRLASTSKDDTNRRRASMTIEHDRPTTSSSIDAENESSSFANDEQPAASTSSTSTGRIETSNEPPAVPQATDAGASLPRGSLSRAGSRNAIASWMVNPTDATPRGGSTSTSETRSPFALACSSSLSGLHRLMVSATMQRTSATDSVSGLNGRRNDADRDSSAKRSQPFRVDLNAEAANGDSPLIAAVRTRRLDVARLLIEAGADVNRCDKLAATPFMISTNLVASGGSSLQQELALDFCELLLRAGADFLRTDKNGQAALHTACYVGSIAIVRLLLNYIAAASTPLQQPDSAPVLASAASSISCETSKPSTSADSEVCTAGSTSTSADAGASSSYSSSNNSSSGTSANVSASTPNAPSKGVLFREAVNMEDRCGRTPFFIATNRGHRNLVEYLLSIPDIDIHVPNREQKSPLYVAAYFGYVDIVRLLLKAGAQVNQADSHNKTALYVATYHGRTDIVDLLLANKAHVNLADKNGKTPLYIAVLHGHLTIAEKLIQAGASVNMADKDGLLPLHMAVKFPKLDIPMVKLLLENGCDPLNLHSFTKWLLMNSIIPEDFIAGDADFSAWLRREESNVRSLKHLCRTEIQRCLGHSDSVRAKCHRLPLPAQLQTFVSLKAL